MTNIKPITFDISPPPRDHSEALAWLLVLVRAADADRIGSVPPDEFKRGWYSIGFLYPGLHPDGAIEDGEEFSHEAQDFPEGRAADPRLIAPRYVESGWPVVLAPLAAEAWRRFESGELHEEEFYCCDAVTAGMCHRDPELAESVRRERDAIP